MRAGFGEGFVGAAGAAMARTACTKRLTNHGIEYWYTCGSSPWERIHQRERHTWRRLVQGLRRGVGTVVDHRKVDANGSNGDKQRRTRANRDERGKGQTASG